ncbi:MAG: hypothetical protein IK066_10870, partial [Kiritimatiellae bacterium]|nr:hypothetical protein [Kiritimatiellia bacterium]
LRPPPQVGGAAQPGTPVQPAGMAAGQGARGGGVSAKESMVASADLPPEVPPQPNGKPWMLLETTHFKVFHDQKIFAEKVARLGEAFYDYISADMPGMVDRVGEGKSVICLFRKAEDWQAFLKTQEGGLEWSASFVRGNAMYLQATGDHMADRMETLAHEMTHLVFNRFLAVRVPRWLNEGLAEYYGMFGYRAVRGMGVSKKGAFPPIRETFPLAMLVSMENYPSDVSQVLLFYKTGKYMVGFLTQREGGEPWKAAWARICAGEPALQAILEEFRFGSVAEMEKEFLKFCK